MCVASIFLQKNEQERETHEPELWNQHMRRKAREKEEKIHELAQQNQTLYSSYIDWKEIKIKFSLKPFISLNKCITILLKQKKLDMVMLAFKRDLFYKGWYHNMILTEANHSSWRDKFVLLPLGSPSYLNCNLFQ